MQISSPCIITPRLCAGVMIGGAFISIEYSPLPGTSTRTRYQYHIDIPDQPEFSADDLQSGCGGGGLQFGLESLLSFLSAAGESVNYAARTGRESENADLFPPYISEWAAAHTDELSMLAYELQEIPGAIEE